MILYCTVLYCTVHMIGDLSPSELGPGQVGGLLRVGRQLHEAEGELQDIDTYVNVSRYIDRYVD